MSLFGTGRREGFLAGLLLVVLALIQHAPGLFFGRVRAPLAETTASEPWREAATNRDVLIPAMQRAGAVVADGVLPTWNPYARLGEPFAASGAPVLHAPFWLLAIGDGRRQLELLLFLHTALACVLAYRMLRTMAISRFAAFVAGGTYGLGQAMTTALDRLPEAAAMALLPWTVAASWRCLFAMRRTAPARWLALALAAGFCTGGHATAALGAMLAVSGFAVGLLAIERSERGPALRALGAAFALCGLLTAPLWLGALEFRGTLDAPRDGDGGIPVTGLLALLAPGLFGGTGSHALRAAVGNADPMTLALYPGAIALFVALLGLMRPKRTRHSLFWFGVAGAGLVLATSGAVGDVARAVVGVTTAKPGVALALFHVAVCVLAALALESFFDAPGSRRFATPIACWIVVALAAGTGLAFVVVPSFGDVIVAGLLDGLVFDDVDRAELLRRVAAPSLAGLGLAVSFLVWRRLGILRFKAAVATIALGEAVVLALGCVPREALIPHATTTDLAGGTRVLCTDDAARATADALPPATRRIDADGASMVGRTRRLFDALAPDFVALLGRAHVGALDVPALLAPPFREALAAGIVLGDRAPFGFTPLVAAPGPADPGASHAPAHRAAADRVRLAWRAVPVADPKAATRAMTSVARNVGDAVVVEGSSPGFVPKRPSTASVIETLVDRPDQVVLHVDVNDGRGWLVLADAFAQGWRCRVDGEPRRILPADVAVRAVELREGPHEVVFEYAPWATRFGLPMTAFGLVLLLLARDQPWRRWRINRPSTRKTTSSAMLVARSAMRSR